MLVVLDGGGQVGQVAKPLPIVPIVMVRTMDGRPLSGIAVLFVVTAGEGRVSIDSADTNLSGEVSVGHWVLGRVAGENRITATIVATGAEVVVRATAIPGPPAKILPTGDAPAYALLSSVKLSPRFVVLDSFDNAVAGTTVRFADHDGTVEVEAADSDINGLVGPGWWLPSSTAGRHSLVASGPGAIEGHITAVLFDREPRIEAVSPVEQRGFVRAHVELVPRVVVSDADGSPVPGVPVLFTLAGGEGEVVGGLTTSDANGIASPVDWRMGSLPNSEVSAVVVGVPGLYVEFHSSGTEAPFLIELRFLTNVMADERDAFAAAALRWMRVITGDVPDIAIDVPPGICANGSSGRIVGVVDDVVVLVSMGVIDGSGGILAAAGPCARRAASRLTIVGEIAFDVADTERLAADGRFATVVLHEMAHVLGFGTAWSDGGNFTGRGSDDPVFVGSAALGAWDELGATYLGRAVPVENEGGQGTRDVHWRESVFGNEIMTGSIESPGEVTPLSRVSIAAMGDLGYQVNPAEADEYSAALRDPSLPLARREVLNEDLRRSVIEIGVKQEESQR